MENITIRKKDLIDLKSELNESMDVLSGFLDGIDCCLFEEDDEVIDAVFSTLTGSVEKIERILQ